MSVAKLDRVSIDGYLSRGLDAMHEAFAENFARRGDLDGPSCAFRRGEKVVDLWGGVRKKQMVPGMRLARLLTIALLLVMSAQASTGLLFPHTYRDADWIRATWFGNDWVTLVVAIPLMILGLVHAARGSPRGVLLWLGGLGYSAYNYAFYLFGARLNAFFPLYVVPLVLAAVVLVLALSHVDVHTVGDSLRTTTPRRLIGGGLIFVGSGLATVWIVIWAAYVFANRPTPVEPEVFKLVAALDLSLMVPTLMMGGVLLWRRAPWGVLVAGIAAIQAPLYLLVLSVNSVVAVQRGLVRAPGEFPIWALLTLLTTVNAYALMANVRSERATPFDQRCGLR